jgi:hypothetical protein
MKKLLSLTTAMVSFVTLFATSITVTNNHPSLPVVTVKNTTSDTLVLESVMVRNVNDTTIGLIMYSAGYGQPTTRHSGTTGSTIRSGRKVAPAQSIQFDFIFEKKLQNPELEFTFIMRDQNNLIHVICCNGN